MEAIEPVRDVDELIDAIAHLLEVVEGPQELERIVDGLLRLGGERTENFDVKTDGLKQMVGGGAEVRQSSASTLMWSFPTFMKLVTHWLGTKYGSPWQVTGRRGVPALEVYDEYFESLAARFRARRFGPVLATPTHRGGWIDPRVFVARLKAMLELELIPDTLDSVIGLLRLAPDFRRESAELAAGLPAPYDRIVRFALGADEHPVQIDRRFASLWLAAGRARQPNGNVPELLAVGLSDREPDGVTAAIYTFLSQTDPKTFKDSRWIKRDTIHCLRVEPAHLEPSVSERPTVALAARVLQPDYFSSFQQDWENELMASLWPANSSATLAFACHRLMMRLDDKGSAFEPVAGLLAPLRDTDRGWSEIGCVAIWLALLSRDDVARGIGIDVMIDGIADGRAHAGPLGKSLLHISSGGWIKLNRLAESLSEVTRSSILAERVVSEILDQLIASWETAPRDAHLILALQLELLSSLRQSPSAKVRARLESIPLTGKSVKLAKQLIALSGDVASPAMRQAAIEAAEGRLTRAERIHRWCKIPLPSNR